MGLTPAQMDAKLDEHFDYERRDDVEGVLSTLAPDAEHDVIGWPLGPSMTPAAQRAFYEKMFADIADGTVTNRKRLYGDNFVVDESVWEGTAVGTPFGLEGRNRPLKFRFLHVVEFDENGLMKREQVWLDQAAIAQQLPQEA